MHDIIKTTYNQESNLTSSLEHYQGIALFKTVRSKFIFWGVIVAILIGIGIHQTLLFYDTAMTQFNFPLTNQYPIRGIDLSHHQGKFDWDKVAVSPYNSFAIMKASEGTDFSDRMFTRNLAEATKHGIPIGAYHFYRFCSDPEKQFRYYSSILSPENLPMGPFVDLEFEGDCADALANEDIIPKVRRFLELSEEYFQKKPVVYSTQEFYNKYLEGKLDDYPLWIRSIYLKPTKIKGRQWTFWQFTHRGRIKGIDLLLDFNVFNGDEAEFKKFLDR